MLHYSTDYGLYAAVLITVLLAASVALIVLSGRREAHRRVAHQADKSQLSTLSLALANMSNGLVMVDKDCVIQLYNARVCSLFGLNEGDMRIGQPLSEYLTHIGKLCGWDEARTRRIIDNHDVWMARDTITRLEHNYDDGTVLSISCRPIQGGGAILTYDDVTEAREGQKKIAHMAFHDALTGLQNRRGFIEALGSFGEEAQLSLLMIDLDRFKAVNDTLGHAIGDKLLICVAQRIRSACEPTDRTFRLGGDELAVLTAANDEYPQRLAASIVAALGSPFQIDEHTITIGCSIGLATMEPGGDPQLVQQMADLALYKAKERGRGRVEEYAKGMIEDAAERRGLELDLAEALSGGQLCLFYQPLYILPGRTLSGFEALLRWDHPERGAVPPATFVPIAEQNGSIVEIGAWVIDEACRQAALWPKDVYVSINVSPVQLRSVSILRHLTKALDRHGIRPGRLEMEITETALLENNEQIAATLAGLRALGVRIAMDDFGTGYSSLAHLRTFELDRIKIDRSFVNESNTDSGSAAVVRAITGMARELAISTTGEGVENEAQLNKLVSLGCDTAQGYLLSRPLDADSATALLRNEGLLKDRRRGSRKAQA